MPFDINRQNAALNPYSNRTAARNLQKPNSEQLVMIPPKPETAHFGEPHTDIKDRMITRLNAMGGVAQQDRMIYDKRLTLNRALMFGTNGANIIRVPFYPQKEIEPLPFRALITNDKLKRDYDDKIVAAPFESGLQPGDIFEWIGTHSYWIVYLQDLVELAYFRSEIRKCTDEIAWQDEAGNRFKTWAAIRGPVETKIDYIQKHGISVDNPNYSLEILMPKNQQTLAYFKRYSKFYLEDREERCWRIEAVDDVGLPGILQLSAVEYYYNKDEDVDGIAGSLVVKPIEPPVEPGEINGLSFIKPKTFYDYSAPKVEGASWSIEGTKNAVILEENGATCRVKWPTGYGGQFTLKYGDKEKLIVVQSLF